MADDLEIRVASDAERTQALANLHDVWSGGMSPEEHLRYRLSYAKHANATWYVGCLGDRVAAGLGCYRFEFRIRGQVEPGFALGEVHTLAEHRGKGFAPRLIAWVEAHQAAQGRKVGMLYSDIDPNYYARLGYVLCPSHEGWAESAAVEEPAGCTLAPFTGRDELASIAALYAEHHAPRAVSVARSPAYWDYFLSRNPQDEFFWGLSPAGERIGYARISYAGNEIKIRDLAVVEPELPARRALLSALLQLGRERGAARVGGWMAATPLHRELFTVTPRTREITMLKSLEGGPPLGPDAVAAVDYFQEMDHV